MSNCLGEFSQACDVLCLAVWVSSVSPVLCLAVWVSSVSPVLCLAVWVSSVSPVLCLAVWVSSVSPVMYSCRVFRAGGETPGEGGRKLCQTHIPLY